MKNITRLASIIGISLAATAIQSNAAVISGITISSVSEENTGNNNNAIFAIDGSGLTGNEHTNAANGNMWMTSSSTTATITFDLGDNYDLTSFNVWNFNQATGANQTSRGANDVQILVADSLGGTFSSVDTVTFAQATGTSDYTGIAFSFVQSDVRLVQFNITSNHGGNRVGLSEVQFDGSLTAIPEARSYAIILGILSLGFIKYRRNLRKIG